MQHTTNSIWNVSQALSQAEYPTLYVVLEDSCFHLQWKHTHAHTQQSLDIDCEIAHKKIHGIGHNISLYLCTLY